MASSIIDPNNKVHFVIVVYSCEEFEMYGGLFSQNTVKLPNDWITPEVYDLIEEETQFHPVLILTHSDKKKLSEQHYIKIASDRFATQHIFFVDNYTKPQQQSKSTTEEVIELLVLNFLVQMKRDESPSQM